MRIQNKLTVLVLISVLVYSVLSFSLVTCSAEQHQVNFQKDLCYDIYYVLQDQGQYLANVKIVGIVVIGEASFLEIQPTNFPQEKSGYILLSCIRTILPVGSMKPQTVG